jgi:hypothetical protein
MLNKKKIIKVLTTYALKFFDKKKLFIFLNMKNNDRFVFTKEYEDFYNVFIPTLEKAIKTNKCLEFFYTVGMIPHKA